MDGVFHLKLTQPLPDHQSKDATTPTRTMMAILTVIFFTRMVIIDSRFFE